MHPECRRTQGWRSSGDRARRRASSPYAIFSAYGHKATAGRHAADGPSVVESLFTLERDTGMGASHRGVLSGHGLLAGDEETQPRAATVGADLQHGAATSVARLLPR